MKELRRQVNQLQSSIEEQDKHKAVRNLRDIEEKLNTRKEFSGVVIDPILEYIRIGDWSSASQAAENLHTRLDALQIVVDSESYLFEIEAGSKTPDVDYFLDRYCGRVEEKTRQV